MECVPRVQDGDHHPRLYTDWSPGTSGLFPGAGAAHPSQLGIWIPSVVREKTRHYWIITTIIAWFFILVILFHKSKYIPKKPFSTAIGGAWDMVLGRPWSKLPYIAKLGVGWGAVLVLFLGATFGIKQTDSSPYKWRVVSLVGMCVMYAACWLLSSRRRAVRAQPIILGLCMQMIFGLLVFKTGAGLSVITWLALAASDLLESGIQGRFLRHEPLRRTLT